MARAPGGLVCIKPQCDVVGFQGNREVFIHLVGVGQAEFQRGVAGCQIHGVHAHQAGVCPVTIEGEQLGHLGVVGAANVVDTESMLEILDRKSVV